jgi:beta-lactamase regulating signal transducer with metallopeptidase domain
MITELDKILYVSTSLAVGTMILLAVIISLAYANFRFAGRRPRQLWAHALWFCLPLALLVALLVNLIQYRVT